MKPILFSDDMVRAILSGRKTQTRRPLKPQPDDDAKIMIGEVGSSKGVAYIGDSTSGGYVTRVVSPYGKVGDLLWVREAFTLTVPNEKPMYRATWKNPDGIKWTSSIHMPRWASRITLEITDIRIERVQEITEEEAISEGFFLDDGVSEVYCFSEAWDSLYAKKGLGWYANPWVWVLTFRRVEG